MGPLRWNRAHYAQNPEIPTNDSQAGRFASHAVHLKHRGVDWDRSFEFRGKAKTETEILVALYSENQSYKEIAQELNRLAGGIAPEHPLIRTEQSVSAKIQALRLAQTKRLQEPNIVLEPYGMVKQSGALVARNAVEFLLDHKHMPGAWLADRLGVQEKSLNRFLQVQHLDGVIKEADANGTPVETFRSSPLISDATEAGRIASKLRENDSAILGLHRAIVQLGRFPTQVQAKGKKTELDRALGTSGAKFFGSGSYSVGAGSGHLRFNPSKIEALERSLTRVETNTELTSEQKTLVRSVLRTELESSKFDALPLAEQNEIVIRRFHQGIAELGEIPSSSYVKDLNGSSLDHVLGMNSPRFFGQSHYADAQPQEKLRLNASRLAAMEASLLQVDANPALDTPQKDLVKRILHQEIEDIKFDALPLTEQNDIVITRLHQAIVVHGKVPSTKYDPELKVSLFDATIKVSPGKVFGLGVYADGNALAKYRLNPSRLSTMELALARVDTNLALDAPQKEVVKIVLEEEIENLNFYLKPLPEQNAIVIRRLHKAIIDNHGSIPSGFYSKELGDSPLHKALRCNLSKFYGQDIYAVGRSQEKTALNRSRLEAIQRALAQLETNDSLNATEKAIVRMALEKEIKKLSP